MLWDGVLGGGGGCDPAAPTSDCCSSSPVGVLAGQRAPQVAAAFLLGASAPLVCTGLMVWVECEGCLVAL